MRDHSFTAPVELLQLQTDTKVALERLYSWISFKFRIKSANRRGNLLLVHREIDDYRWSGSTSIKSLVASMKIYSMGYLWSHDRQWILFQRPSRTLPQVICNSRNTSSNVYAASRGGRAEKVRPAFQKSHKSHKSRYFRFESLGIQDDVQHASKCKNRCPVSLKTIDWLGKIENSRLRYCQAEFAVLSFFSKDPSWENWETVFSLNSKLYFTLTKSAVIPDITSLSVPKF